MVGEEIKEREKGVRDKGEAIVVEEEGDEDNWKGDYAVLTRSLCVAVSRCWKGYNNVPSHHITSVVK